MRATENNAKGTSGQSFVKGLFEELGWGVAPNLEHDLGTDLFLMARDARLVDLGALVGAQVKNWAFQFDEPEINKGVEGWWFADTAEHFEYWLDHRVPHIVAIYDKWAKVTHWVHVTHAATVSTGKGRKIFVPKSQTVDAAHFDDLIAVATSGPKGQTWEGSAWLPGQEIPQSARLRYAMIVPRLIAPHGNSSIDGVSADQAIALLTAYRIWEIDDHLKDTQPLLVQEASLDADDPSWKLYGALRAWAVDGEISGLKGRLPEAAAEVRAAHTAMLAAALFEAGDASGAAEAVEAALAAPEEYNPVDQAWLMLHLARSVVQLGRISEAKTLALNVVPIAQLAPSDPTARFLTGVASDIVFTLNGWRADDLANTIQARDNAASWWRSQSMTSGLAAHLEMAFADWANDGAITFKAIDVTWTRLRSATLISGFGADTPNWGHEASLLAQYMLMREGEAKHVAAALSLLRIAGAEKPVKLAMEHLLDHGPIEGIELAIEDVDLDLSTRASLQADLEMVGLAAPIVAEGEADRIMGWLLNEVANPSKRATALAIRFLYPELLWTTVARLYLSCSSEMQAAVRGAVVGAATLSDQSVAHEVARVVSTVQLEDWTADEVSALSSRVAGDNFELREAIEVVVARRDPEYRVTLLDRIANGDVQALTAWGDVRDLPADSAKSMITASARSVRAELTASRNGAYSFGGPSALRRLVLLNVWHPTVADWTECIEALSDENSNPNDILPGLDFLVLQAGHIPDQVRKALRASLRRLAETPPRDDMFGSFMKGSDVRGSATELLATLFPDDVPRDRTLQLLGGSTADVRTAVRMLAARDDESALSLLASLAANDDTDVRSAVAAALAGWVSRGIGGDDTQVVLTRLLSEPGVRLATHVTRAIASEPRTGTAEVIVDLLASHPSSVVRRHVQIIKRRWSAYDSA